MGIADQLNKTFFNASGSALVQGTIIRATTGVNQATTALSSGGTADVIGVMSSLRAGLGSAFLAQTAGETQVLMETGLTLVAGQQVFVSASVAGRGTNVAPANATSVGYITDVSKYASRSLVSAVFFGGKGAQSASADWLITLTRYFIVDNELGNDANLGYIDAVEGTDLSATAPTVAVKTLERLLAIIPTVGNNRRAQIIAKARSDGGRYLAADGVTESNFYLNTVGYQRLILRGTGTVTSAGAIAWSNSAADLMCQGGRIATGTDAAGYKLSYNLIGTVGSATPGTPISLTVVAHGLATGDCVFVESVYGTTGANGRYIITVTDANNFTLNGSTDTETWLPGGTQRVYAARITKADGSAAGFTTDTSDTTITGLRVRYAVGSSTGVSNVVNTVWSNGAASILFATPWATVPLTSDIFYLEEPGLNIRRVSVSAIMGYGEPTAGAASVNAGMVVSGFRAATLSIGRPAYVITAFVHPYTLVGVDSFQITLGITAPFTGQTNTTVGANRIGDSTAANASSLYISKCLSVSMDHTYFVRRSGAASTVVMASIARLRVGQACGFARGMILRSVGAAPGSPAGRAVAADDSCFGRIGTGGNMPVRIFGPESTTVAAALVGLFLDQVSIVCQSLVTEILDATGIGIVVSGNGCRVVLSNVNGSSNHSYGLSLNVNNNAVVEGGARDNTVLISHLQVLPNGISGGLGSYQVGARDGGTAVVSKVDLTSNIAYSDIVDTNGCRICVLRTSPGNLSTQVKLQLQRTGGYINNTGGTLARYRVVRATTVKQEIALAQANTSANATGVLGALFNAPLTTAYGIVVQAGEETFIEFDRSGAHPAPTIGQLAYLAVDTAGLAQADVPATAATNQLFVLGVITALHPTNTDIAAVQLAPSARPALA